MASTVPARLQPREQSPVPGLRILSMASESPLGTIICSHGGLDRGASFSRMARRLTNFEVWSYDRRGYQGSRALAPFTLAHHIEDLAALAADAKQRGPVILFGHSFGGLVAFGVAVTHPELVDDAEEDRVAVVRGRSYPHPVPHHPSLTSFLAAVPIGGKAI